MDNSSYKDKSFYKDYKKSLDTIVPNIKMQDIDWETVASRLPLKKEKKRPIYFWWSAASLVGIFLFLSFIYLNSKSSKTLYSDANNIHISRQSVIDHCNLTKEPQIGSFENNNLHKNANKSVLASKPNKTQKQSYNIQSIIQPLNNKFETSEKILNLITDKNNESYIAQEPITTPYITYNGLTKSLISNSFENNAMPSLSTLIDSNTNSFKVNQKYNLEGINQLIIENPPLLLRSTNQIIYDTKVVLNLTPLSFAHQSKHQWLGRVSYGKYFEKNHIEFSLPAFESPVLESVISAKDGQQLGMFLLMSMNTKWRFGLGVNYTTLNFETSHNTLINSNDISYKSTSDENIKRYNYDYNLFDGAISSRVQLSFFETAPNQAINLLDTFNLSMSISRNIRSFQIPFIVERKIINFNQLSIYGKLGGAISVHSSIKNALIHHNESCKELCLIDGFDPEITSTLSSKLNISGILGFGLEYKLSPNITFGVSPDFIIHPNHNYTSWQHQQSLAIYLSHKIK